MIPIRKEIVELEDAIAYVTIHEIRPREVILNISYATSASEKLVRLALQVGDEVEIVHCCARR